MSFWRRLNHAFCWRTTMIRRRALDGSYHLDCDACGWSVPAVKRTEDELAAMREKFRAVSAPKAERRRTTMRRIR